MGNAAKGSWTLALALIGWIAAAPASASAAAAESPAADREGEEAPAPPMKMKRYFLALLYKGPTWSPGESPEVVALQEGHLANIRRLADAGKLVLAGPFEDAGDLRGLFVLDAASIEEARALCDSDPAIAAGRLRAEIFAWWAPEGVGVVPPAAAP
jgi:uncharacterized protein YciI